MRYNEICETDQPEEHITDEEISTYTAGYCHVFAFALNDLLPDSDTIAVYDYDMDIESEVITHVFIRYKNLFMDVATMTENINDILNEYEDHGEQAVVVNNNRSSITELAGSYSTIDYKNAKQTARKYLRIYR